MPFSVLLLTAVSSERHISGYGGDRVSMQTPRAGEVALFFDKIDGDIVRQSLGVGKKCCDGIIFYAHGTQKVICLVEMKSANLGEAEEQIKETYTHLREMLKKECTFCKDYLQQINWRAYIYRSGAAPKKDADRCVERLEKCGFAKGNVKVLDNPDITEFLRKESKRHN
ncbi:MAG: hypothetical protein JO202_04020 [Ktedonobacteraceae bacterium]|nr:hypothetical protein [Ktedonobacteraceae bacterium]